MRQNLELYGQWLRRDLSLRYAGSVLGPLWLIVQPLLYIAVFTLVFYKFFSMRWPTGDGSALDYGLKVFIGLSLYTFFADVLQRSSVVLASHAYLVTKVRFPLPLLSSVTVGSAAIQLVASLVLVLPFSFARGGGWEVLLLPLLLLPLLLLAIGAGWLLSGLGVYLRDIGNLMPSITSFMMFLTPIFYPAELVPPSLRWIVQFNPLAWSVESVRLLLLQAQVPHWQGWGAHGLAAMVFTAIAWWFFKRIQPGFADVL
jgi:lipopolysaccharide transport system permease protein